jgi:fibronectin type 3 domain-containing protein
VTGAGLVVGPALTAGAASATLPFDLVASTGSHLVFAHYFTPYPVSLDNADPANDYYARNYLSPTGEGGAHSAYGGLLRDRPVPHTARSESNWLVLNMQDEIRQAKASGINGFTVDLLTTPTSTNTNIRNAQNNILTAADGVGGFPIQLMPDMSGGLASLTAADLAAMVAGYGAHASAFKLADGRLVVSPFKAEAHPATWWTDFMNVMATTYKMPVALVPCFLNESAYEASFAPISYGMSDWGSRNPAWNDPSATATPMAKVARVHNLGKIWMQPVSVQDERPNQSIYDEAQNTQNLRNTWQIAIASNAEWVQLTTWNDYSEGAQVAPSVQHGWTFTDLTAYYGQWFRTGVAPPIVRDAVYLTHRVQPYAASPTFAQTSLMKLRGGSPSRDTVEALSMLTAPGTVSVTVGGVTTSCAAPAGVSTCTVPLQSGRAAAAVVRNGSLVASVATTQTITAKPNVQDLQYVGAASLRDGPADPSLLGVTPTPTPTTPTTPSPTPTTPAPTPTTPAPPPTSPAPTPSVPVSQTVTVQPAEDAFANAGAPATNYGADSTLVSRGSVGSASYLRFAMPATPTGTELSAAQLTWRTTTDASAPSADAHTVRVSSGSWSETTLTWNNHPSVGSLAVGTMSGASSTNTAYTSGLDPGALASSYPATGGTISLSVSSTGTDGLFFWSRHAATASYRPYLTLSYSHVTVVKDTTAPTAPGAPTATMAGQNVSLAWAAATDDTAVTEYAVYRSDIANTDPATADLVATTTSTSFVDVSPGPGTWYYQVVASDAAGNHSAASAETAIVVPDLTAPSSPTVSTTVTGYDAEVTWTESTDDVGVAVYRVYRSATSFSPSDATLVATTTGNSLVDTDRDVGSWHYVVVAVDAAGNASVPGTATANVVDITAPAAPTASIDIVGSSVTVSWLPTDDNVGTVRYDVHRAAAPFVPDASTLVGSTASTSYVDAGRTYGTWYYVVVAVDAAGNRSEASAAVSTTVVDTLPPSAPVVTASVDAHGVVTVAWSGASDDAGVVAYAVHRSASPFTPSDSTIIATTTATTLVDSSRPVGTWYYVVVALDAAGNFSSPSSMVPATVVDVVAPSTPVVSGSASGSVVTLTWPAGADNVGVVAYDVSRIVSGTKRLLGSVTATRFSETVADGTWSYFVSARDGVGNRSASGTLTVTVSTPVVQVVKASADAWVNASAPTRSYGGASNLSTRGTPGAAAYLKFVLPAAPAGHTLSSIVLTVRTMSTTGSGTSCAQTVRLTGDGWSETSLTWNGRPSTTGTQVGAISAAPALNAAYRISLVAATTLAAKTSTGHVNLALVATGSDLWTIASTQNPATGVQPTLTLTYR